MTHAEVGLVIAGSSLGYLVFAGVMYAIAMHRKWDFNDSPTGVCAVIFWPLVLPAWLAATATTAIFHRSSTTIPRAVAREKAAP